MLEALVAVVVLFAAYAFYALDKERKRAIERERELLSAILSANVEQYLGAVERLRTSPKDKLVAMKLENELAVAAAKLEDERGIPVR
jgi:hypothetical protein